MTTATTDERTMVHIRLPKPLLKRVDHRSVDWETDRARTIERLLERALEEDASDE